MKCALVSLPWASAERPSMALGILPAYIRAAEPGYQVDTFHLSLGLMRRLGDDLFNFVASGVASSAEGFYACLLYPEKRESFQQWFLQRYTQTEENKKIGRICLAEDPVVVREIFKKISSEVDQHLTEVLNETDWGQYDVVGMTTNFFQLFANICFAKKLKANFPDIVTVLGGAIPVGRVAPSILKEYDVIDHIVVGEGEAPFLSLLRRLVVENTENGRIPGICSRDERLGSLSVADVCCSQLDQLAFTELPLPDYDEFVRRRNEHGYRDWTIPVEASRGCWWGSCKFCSLNATWKGYRVKNPKAVMDGVEALARKYSNNYVFFVDNLLRIKDLPDFLREIRGRKLKIRFFYELRAHLRPHELLDLWEVGLERIQLGVEALSTGVLKRMFKGTSTVQNLQVMKISEELGIDSNSNLILYYPGTTQAEVEETVHNMMNYAIGFRPLSFSFLTVGVGSELDRNAPAFGLKNIRNHDNYKHCLPHDVYQRVVLPELSFDSVEPPADWHAVRMATLEWSRRYAGRPKGLHLLTYWDSGEFIRVEDSRFDQRRSYVFKGLSRDVYMFCQQIRSMGEVMKFIDESSAEEEIREFLDRLVSLRLMYREKNQFLSLACAHRAIEAAERIRAAQRAAREGKERGSD